MENETMNVLDLFRPPFWYDKEGGYIFDANNQMIGEVRAWGFLQKFENGGAMQDELGEKLVQAFNQLYTKPTTTPTLPE